MYRPKYTSSFLICQNLNDLQTFKNISCKKVFLQCLCYRCHLLRWIFLLSVITGRRYFFKKFAVTVKFFQPPYCPCLWNKPLERRPFLHYLRNNRAVLMLMAANAKFQNKAILYYFYTYLKNVRSWLSLW